MGTDVKTLLVNFTQQNNLISSIFFQCEIRNFPMKIEECFFHWKFNQIMATKSAKISPGNTLYFSNTMKQTIIVSRCATWKSYRYLWYLIVSIPDLCTPTYLNNESFRIN